MEHRIWIELERPKANAAFANDIGDERAAMLTKMLARLCEPSERIECRWDRNAMRYKLIYGPMRVETLNDDGQWFLLNYFGRD